MIIIIGVAAGIVTIAIGVCGSARWIYRRGQESGKAQADREADRRAQAEAQAKIQTLEASIRDIQAELDRVRVRRPRALFRATQDRELLLALMACKNSAVRCRDGLLTKT